MEQLIQQLDHMTLANDAFAHWGTASPTDPEGLSVFRQEAEWFVNHICERVEAASAVLMWGAALSPQPPPNRHRHDELRPRHRDSLAPAGTSSSMMASPTSAMMNGRLGRASAASKRTNFSKCTAQRIRYHSAEEDDVWKLRHPMPLFGRVTGTLIPQIYLRAA